MKIQFIRPSRGVKISADPTNPEFLDRKTELATDVRQRMDRERPIIRNITGELSIAPKQLGDDDTAWPPAPVVVRHMVEIVEVKPPDTFIQYLEDGSSRPGEPIVMPLHATSILFSARHDRSDAWYTTGIITVEDQALRAGESILPYFVWIEHTTH